VAAVRRSGSRSPSVARSTMRLATMSVAPSPRSTRPSWWSTACRRW
jgi:hypothetical protein